MIKFEMEILDLNLFSVCTLPFQVSVRTVRYELCKSSSLVPPKNRNFGMSNFVPHLKEGVKNGHNPFNRDQKGVYLKSILYVSNPMS